MNFDEINQQFVKSLTSQFIATMTTQIGQRVVDNVANIVNSFDVKKEIADKINQSVNQAVDSFASKNNTGPAAIGEELVTKLSNKSQEFLDGLTATIHNKVFTELQSRIASTDFVHLIRDTANHHVSNMLKNHAYTFPANSIPSKAIQHQDLAVKADNIEPGVIKKFESTGIQDKASSCRLTISDNAIITETTLISKDMHVIGTLKVDGDLDNGLADRVALRAVEKIESKYNEGTFDQYVNRVIQKIDTEGLDVSKIKYKDTALVKDNALHDNIVHSNLQYLGLIRELQVSGETLLDDTLYVANKRLGLNTLEPEHVFDIWDQEVQVIATKKQKDTAYFGTGKLQNLILGTNLQNQLILHSSGEISLARVTVGKVTFSSSPWEPRDNRQVGEIVWNEQPQLGQPIGWVSLGGARWAKFGIITDI